MALAGTLNVELNHAVPGPCPYEMFMRKPTDKENPGAKVEKNWCGGDHSQWEGSRFDA